MKAAMKKINGASLFMLETELMNLESAPGADGVSGTCVSDRWSDVFGLYSDVFRCIRFVFGSCSIVSCSHIGCRRKTRFHVKYKSLKTSSLLTVHATSGGSMVVHPPRKLFTIKEEVREGVRVKL